MLLTQISRRFSLGDALNDGPAVRNRRVSSAPKRFLVCGANQAIGPVIKDACGTPAWAQEAVGVPVSSASSAISTSSPSSSSTSTTAFCPEPLLVLLIIATFIGSAIKHVLGPSLVPYLIPIPSGAGDVPTWSVWLVTVSGWAALALLWFVLTKHKQVKTEPTSTQEFGINTDSILAIGPAVRSSSRSQPAYHRMSSTLSDISPGTEPAVLEEDDSSSSAVQVRRTESMGQAEPREVDLDSTLSTSAPPSAKAKSELASNRESLMASLRAKTAAPTEESKEDGGSQAAPIVTPQPLRPAPPFAGSIASFSIASLRPTNNYTANESPSQGTSSTATSTQPSAQPINTLPAILRRCQEGTTTQAEPHPEAARAMPPLTTTNPASTSSSAPPATTQPPKEVVPESDFFLLKNCSGMEIVLSDNVRVESDIDMGLFVKFCNTNVEVAVPKPKAILSASTPTVPKEKKVIIVEDRVRLLTINGTFKLFSKDPEKALMNLRSMDPTRLDEQEIVGLQKLLPFGKEIETIKQMGEGGQDYLKTLSPVEQMMVRLFEIPHVGLQIACLTFMPTFDNTTSLLLTDVNRLMTVVSSVRESTPLRIVCLLACGLAKAISKDESRSGSSIRVKSLLRMKSCKLTTGTGLDMLITASQHIGSNALSDLCHEFNEKDLMWGSEMLANLSQFNAQVTELDSGVLKAENLLKLLSSSASSNDNTPMASGAGDLIQEEGPNAILKAFIAKAKPIVAEIASQVAALEFATKACFAFFKEKETEPETVFGALAQFLPMLREAIQQVGQKKASTIPTMSLPSPEEDKGRVQLMLVMRDRRTGVEGDGQEEGTSTDKEWEEGNWD